jgi:peroxiredoxin
MLRVGDKTPAVSGTSYEGTTFDLGTPRKRTVLWFYPRASTGG